MALQEASAAYLVRLFEDTNLCTIHAKSRHPAKGHLTRQTYPGQKSLKQRKGKLGGGKADHARRRAEY